MKSLFLIFLLVCNNLRPACLANTAGLYYKASADSTDDCGGSSTNMVTVLGLTHGAATCASNPYECSAFDATHYDVGNTGLLTNFSSTQWTVEGYFYTASLPLSDNIPVSWIIGGTNFRIDILSSGAVCLQTNSLGFLCTSAGYLPLNTCVHIAGHWDGTNRRVYIDNVQCAIDTVNGAGGTVTALNVGRDYTLGGYPFPGKITGLRFSSVARTSFPSVDTTPTPTWTPTSTFTFSPTTSPTPTHTPTITQTFTFSPTTSPTPTHTPTWTQTRSPTLTHSPTLTFTFSPTITLTPTPTWTRTATPTHTPTWTPTQTLSFTISPTPTITRTASQTATPTPIVWRFRKTMSEYDECVGECVQIAALTD